MKGIGRLGDWREFVLRGMGWAHCGMVFALLYGTVLRIVQGEQVLPGAVWRGMLWVLPLAVVDFAAEKCRKLWQYAGVSLVACALSWLLLGYVWTAIPVGLVCLLRGHNRLQEEPVESALDRPCLPFLATALLPFLYSALGGGALLQKVSLVWAALYGLLFCAWSGFRNIQEYLWLNRTMAGVPVKRIVRTSGLAVVSMVVLAGVMLLPSLIGNHSYFRIESQGKQQVVVVESAPMEMNFPTIPEKLRNMAQESTFRIPSWVTTVFMGLLGAFVLCLMFYGIYLILRNFRNTFVDHRDVVQYLRGPEDAQEHLEKQGKKRPSLWDRSPNAQVRRKYRREVLRAGKEPPPFWAAPQEIEDAAGLKAPLLHQLYEKARYSQEGCSVEESKMLRR